jgi:flagellar hook assembly protein FlgD
MYRLNVDSQVVYKFYDARGRLLQEVDLGEVAVSATEIEYLWDGRDSQGRPLTSGIYWAVMEVENERSVRKFSIVR